MKYYHKDGVSDITKKMIVASISSLLARRYKAIAGGRTEQVVAIQARVWKALADTRIVLDRRGEFNPLPDIIEWRGDWATGFFAMKTHEQEEGDMKDSANVTGLRFAHDKLPAGFKVKLTGDNFPAGYQNGDILDIFNWLPEDGDLLLVKIRGKHKILTLTEWMFMGQPGLYLGVIQAFKRSMNADIPLYLGKDPDFVPTPKRCNRCDNVEVIEAAGQVGAYCKRAWDKLMKLPLYHGGCSLRTVTA